MRKRNVFLSFVLDLCPKRETFNQTKSSDENSSIIFLCPRLCLRQEIINQENSTISFVPHREILIKLLLCPPQDLWPRKPNNFLCRTFNQTKSSEGVLFPTRNFKANSKPILFIWNQNLKFKKIFEICLNRNLCPWQELIAWNQLSLSTVITNIAWLTLDVSISS